MNSIKDLFILPWLFARICWDQGIRKALEMTWDKVTHRAFRAQVRFPHVPPSNAASYLPLLKLQPLVSVVMPVRNSRWLAEAVASVLGQHYRHFELVLVDDASTEPAALKALAAAEADQRVRVLRNQSSLGISGATNAGIEAAAGEYVAFMDHDDLLHHDALALFVRTLNDGRDADVFYSDENRIDEDGYIIGATRKCELSLDLLLSCNAVGHLCIVKRGALRRLGPLKSEYDGAQDHDLVLRAWEQGMTFYHLPYLLYGWRMHRQSMSDGTRKFPANSIPKSQGVSQVSPSPSTLNHQPASAYPRAWLSGQSLIQAYLERHGIRARVTGDGFPWYRVRYSLPSGPEEVAIIVPFKDKVARLKVLLASLAKTAYPHYRLFLVNNRSERTETRAYLETLRADPRVTRLEFDEPFNYARLHNATVKKIPNELLLFLNNDMEIIQPDWLDAMLEHIHRERVGAVGCKLIIDQRTIQHAGMAFRPSVLFCALNLTDADEFYTRVQRDVSGVTAACMLIRKSAFEGVGGFDETHFPIGFSDSDLCLKLVQAGYKIIYTPFAALVHHESQSRRLQEEGYEMVTLFRRYGGRTPLNDPHYPSQFIAEQVAADKGRTPSRFAVKRQRLLEGGGPKPSE